MKKEPIGVCLKDSDEGGMVTVELGSATVMMNGQPYPISDVHLRLFTAGGPLKAGQQVGLLDNGTVIEFTGDVQVTECVCEAEEPPSLDEELARLGGELDKMKLP